jgi:ATP-dependent DNA helicase RecG
MYQWVEQQLLDLVTQALQHKTETTQVEFKDSTGGLSKKSLWRTISSFSNSQGGGVVAFGIKEGEGQRPEVVGIENLVTLQQDIVSYISEKMINCGKYSLKTLVIEGKKVLALAIDEVPPNEKPCYNKDFGLPRGACIRLGNVDKQITEVELRAFLQYSPQYQYDRTPATDATFEDLSEAKIQNFLTRSAQGARRPVPTKAEKIKKVLRNASVLVQEGNALVPTLAGLLLFGKDVPQDFEVLRHTYIQCVRYSGTNPGTDILDKKSVFGSLNEQIDTAHKFILENIKTSAKIVGTQRVDRLEYPTDVLREAIINALLHRDYSNQGTVVNVSVYSNRIEILNPGGLPPGFTVAKLRESQFSRNKVIVETLLAMNFLERLGRGIDLMYEDMEKWELPEPLFFSDSFIFKVTILGPQFSGLNERQLKIWEFLQHQYRITIKEAEEFNAGVTRRTVISDLGNLEKKGFIKGKESGPSRYYQLA